MLRFLALIMASGLAVPAWGADVFSEPPVEPEATPPVGTRLPGTLPGLPEAPGPAEGETELPGILPGLPINPGSTPAAPIALPCRSMPRDCPTAEACGPTTRTTT